MLHQKQKHKEIQTTQKIYLYRNTFFWEPSGREWTYQLWDALFPSQIFDGKPLNTKMDLYFAENFVDFKTRFSILRFPGRTWWWVFRPRRNLKCWRQWVRLVCLLETHPNPVCWFLCRRKFSLSVLNL